MNGLVDQAWRAYHDCNFARAINILECTPTPGADAAILVMKSHIELDAPGTAIQFCEQQGRLRRTCEQEYWLGVALYLAGYTREDVAAAFQRAAEGGFPGAGLGLAFLHFASGNYAAALDVLSDVAVFGDGEYEHIRQQMRCQIALAARDWRLARSALEAADSVLRDCPSSLRQLWGDLCWVRYWRGVGEFAQARWLVQKIMRQANIQATRLHRNAQEALQHIDAANCQGRIDLPSATELTRRAQARDIYRKPTLNQLFEYLKAQGDRGGTKEDIVQSLWGEAYNPMIHDDRIYKSVGRLRRILADDSADSNVILQRGEFYILAMQSPNLESRV